MAEVDAGSGQLPRVVVPAAVRAGRFDVSVELLAQLLHLPPNATIIGAQINGDLKSVKLVVDDPALPDAPEPHDTTPTFTQERITMSWSVDG